MTLSSRAALAVLLAASAVASAQDDLSLPDFSSLKAASRSVATPAAQAAAAPRVPGQPDRVDLDAQFPRTRDGEMQGAIGDCHDFATVALLETAIKRATGETRLLSPTDLFVHHTLKDSWDAEGNYVYGGVTAANEADLTEGDYLDKDVRYALSHGIATLKDEPYWPFYSEYRDGYLPQLKSKLTVAEQDLTPDQRAALRRAMRRRVPKGDEAEQDRFRQEGAAIRQTVADDVIKPELEDVVARVDRKYPRAKASRERTLALVKGFRVEERDYATKYVDIDAPARFGPSKTTTRNLNQLSPSVCLSDGAERGAWIMGQLAKGRPVGIAIDVAGMDTWGTQKMKGAPLNHAIVIIGYQNYQGHEYFRTLNWWGKNHWGNSSDYPIRDDQFCHIYQSLALLAPGER